MLEWNVSLVSSLITLKWEVLQTPWQDERPRRGIWIYWSTGQSATAGRSFNRGKCGLLSWDGAMSDTSRGWEMIGWEQLRRKGPWSARDSSSA